MNKSIVKRALAAILAAATLLSVSGLALAVPDEITGHWAQETLAQWVDAGYLNGDENGKLLPDKAVTRAEFMAMMNRRVGYTAKADISNYADVSPNAWYYGDVAIGVQAGYLNGTSAIAMSPERRITRQEMAVVIARVCGLEDDAAALNSFADAGDFADYAKGPAGAAVAAGLLQGD
ncbi:MAG: S-layer homology domain-containing protein, partial [Oscillospiraceae bacterium]|nr:S-layer homology domain-containing protein [Oscillospiraceae bacterium]